SVQNRHATLARPATGYARLRPPGSPAGREVAHATTLPVARSTVEIARTHRLAPNPGSYVAAAEPRARFPPYATTGTGEHLPLSRSSSNRWRGPVVRVG